MLVGDTWRGFEGVGWRTDPNRAGCSQKHTFGSARFCILGNHGSSPKHRLIYDYEMPGARDTLAFEDTSAPQGLKKPFLRRAHTAPLVNQTHLLLPGIDFAHARKHISIQQTQ